MATTLCIESDTALVAAVYIGDDLAIAAVEPGVEVHPELLDALGVQLADSVVREVSPERIMYLGEYPDRLEELFG